ncbi:hypothetical protein ACFC1R_34515 [Kitasatospora sp. NPDC056138]|uniref:hypothetical protein n=1 Tax=Kitasatospora sp. NPDC056138 TaxID=3345724 RepID=UPI0035E182C6
MTARSNAIRAQPMVLDRDPQVTGLARQPVRLQFTITAPQLETAEKLADVVSRALTSSGPVKVGKPQPSEKKKRVPVDLTELKPRP